MTDATTDEDTQTTGGLVISRNPVDGAEVTHFKITGIANGTLYKSDGTTQITDGSFITVAEGNAGLKFTPSTNFNGSGSFTVQASTSNVDRGWAAARRVRRSRQPVNDAPTMPGVALSATNEDAVWTMAVSGHLAGYSSDVDAGAFSGTRHRKSTTATAPGSTADGTNWFDGQRLDQQRAAVS